MIPDLRKKLLFTLLIIIVFRIGSVIPVPFIDTQALQQAMEHSVNSGESSNMIGYLDTISGGAFSNATIFAMGITPYINSSIIIQLLCVAIPALERLSKEGEAGRRKIGTITRYVTVGLGLIQGTAYFFYLKNSTDSNGRHLTKYNEGFSMVFAAIVIVLVFTAGTALMMWLGEQINKYGIGNGISILLFAGIIARLPFTVNALTEYWKMGFGNGEEDAGDPSKFILVILWVVLFLAVIWLITFMQDSERRIPIQYANVIGGDMWGRYVDQQIPFVGLGNSAFRRNCLAIARLDGRLRIGNNHYVTLMGNVGYDFVGLNEFSEGEFMSGAGLSYAYNSIFGPLKLQLHWSSLTQRVGAYLSLGFVF